MDNTNNSQINPIKFGRTLEEAQRKNDNEQNDVDEQNDAENEKFNLLINFVDTNGENSFLAKSEIYNEDEHDIDEDDQNETEFIQQHKSNIKQYGTLKNFDESQQFLEEHIELVSEEVFNYLHAWSINIHMEPDVFGMEMISRQAMIIKFIIKSIKKSKLSASECTREFFEGIRNHSIRKKFRTKLNKFRENIDECAAQKNEDLIQKQKQEQRDQDATVNDEEEIDTQNMQKTEREQ